MSHQSGEQLDHTLARLLSLCDRARSHTVNDLRERLAHGRVRVLLVGEAKRGKSTLGNALLGREVLPTGVTPVTAISTVITTGAPERVEVRFLDGRTERVPLTALADYVTERANPDNARGVDLATVLLHRGLPSPDLTIVDTPGVGSVFRHNTAEARSALERMDLAVFVLTADPPMSASEADLLAEVGERAVATFIVLNKVDRLSPAELGETLDFLSSVHPGIEVLPCSARAGLEARLARRNTAYRESGMQAIADQVTARVTTRGAMDLQVSIASAAQHVADALSDEVTVTRAALAARNTARQDQVDAFRGRLDALPAAAADAQARVGWRLRELRRSLADDASTRSASLVREARAEIDRLLGLPEHRSSPAAQLRAAGDEALEAITQRGVGAWRDTWTKLLADHLAGIVAEENDHLDKAARSVRESAERDLGVHLHTSQVAIELPNEAHFRFDFADPVGWEAPLAGQVRRHVPGTVARRRTGTGLRRRAGELPDKHLGRARHDLDQRLDRAHRGLASTLAERYHELGDGLTRSLDAAATARTLTAQEVEVRQRELAARRATLTELATALDRIVVPARS